MRWAEERSLLHLIQVPAPEHRYYVRVITDWIPSDPVDYKHHKPAPVPAKEDLSRAIQRLVDSWPKVAGALAGECHPLKFTGSKGRRLLVLVTGEAQPPWGGWFRLADSPKRLEFTAFRKRVNEALAPHHVDHVDFRHG